MFKLQRIILRRKLFYYFYCLVILAIAYFLDRFFQMLLFILFFNAIQNSFNYRFHAETVIPDDPIKSSFVCKLITIGVEIIYLIFCKDLNVSVYSNLFVIFTFSFLNALLQFFLERSFAKSCILKSKELLLNSCEEAGLSSEATNRLVLRYIEHKSIKEIASIEYVTEEAVKQSIRRSKRKLHI